jgi:hypothetical protein
MSALADDRVQLTSQALEVSNLPLDRSQVLARDGIDGFARSI